MVSPTQLTEVFMKHLAMIFVVTLFTSVVVPGQSKTPLYGSQGDDGTGAAPFMKERNPDARQLERLRQGIRRKAGDNPVHSFTHAVLTPSQISAFPFQDAYSQYFESFPVVLGDGSIMVLWAEYYGDTLFSVRSTDGGDTWSLPSFVSVTTYCSALCGLRTSGGTIVAIWSSLNNGLTMSYSTNDGTTWSSPSSIASNPADEYCSLTQTLDGRLWLSYSRNTPSTYYDVFYRTSTNNGLSWSDESTLLATPATEIYGSIISRDTSTLLAFYNSGGSVYFKPSTDGGATWGTAVLAAVGPVHTLFPRVLRQSDGTLWLVYQAYLSVTATLGQSEIFSTKSTDGGATWMASTRFTNYAGYDGWHNTCLYTNTPFITFASTRWGSRYTLWYGIVGTSSDNSTPPCLLATTRSDSTSVDGMYSTIAAYVADEKGISDVTMTISCNDIRSEGLPMYDDGANGDQLAGDNIWGRKLGPFQLGDEVYFDINMTDVDQNFVSVYGGEFGVPAVHDAGNVVLAFHTNSELGNGGRTPTTSAYWPKSNGYSYLFDGGLWVGCTLGAEARVICHDYSTRLWHRTVGTPVTLAAGTSDQDGDVTYEDDYSLGLQVHQQSYQWAADGRNDFIIFNYTLTNFGNYGPITDLYVALWNDPDVALQTSSANNVVGYDSQRKLAYISNADNTPAGYYGIMLLSSATPHNVTCYPISSDPYTEKEHYDLLEAIGTTIPAESNDYRMLVTAPPFSLDVGASKSVAYGIVLGDGLAELQAHADTMSAVYNQVLTGVGDDRHTWSGVIPSSFDLHQNYPNPFNPTTVVRYQLPVASSVKLVVYDILGREMAVLANEKKNAGSYEVKFDAEGLSSGVYFYRMQAGDFTETKRLLLLK